MPKFLLCPHRHSEIKLFQKRFVFDDAPPEKQNGSEKQTEDINRQLEQKESRLQEVEEERQKLLDEIKILKEKKAEQDKIKEKEREEMDKLKDAIQSDVEFLDKPEEILEKTDGTVGLKRREFESKDSEGSIRVGTKIGDLIRTQGGEPKLISVKIDGVDKTELFDIYKTTQTVQLKDSKFGIFLDVDEKTVFDESAKNIEFTIHELKKGKIVSIKKLNLQITEPTSSNTSDNNFGMPFPLFYTYYISQYIPLSSRGKRALNALYSHEITDVDLENSVKVLHEEKKGRGKGWQAAAFQLNSLCEDTPADVERKFRIREVMRKLGYDY